MNFLLYLFFICIITCSCSSAPEKKQYNITNGAFAGAAIGSAAGAAYDQLNGGNKKSTLKNAAVGAAAGAIAGATFVYLMDHQNNKIIVECNCCNNNDHQFDYKNGAFNLIATIEFKSNLNHFFSEMDSEVRNIISILLESNSPILIKIHVVNAESKKITERRYQRIVDFFNNRGVSMSRFQMINNANIKNIAHNKESRFKERSNNSLEIYIFQPKKVEKK